MESQRLCRAVLSKIEEQIEGTLHLIDLLPVASLEWTPAIPGAWNVGLLLGHMLDVLAGFCAVLAAANPGFLAHFEELRKLPVNHTCSPKDAVTRVAGYRSHIAEGFALLEDGNLGDMVPTVFVPDGEPLITLLLGNLEHLINHKHQLFTYLKQMGVDVSTRDLYQLRGV
jgi:hypothetical protein